MGARAEKNPVVKGHYSTMDTPLQVTEPGPDPRPGEDSREGGAWAKGGPVQDPLGFVNKLVPGKHRFPMGEMTKNDKSLGHKGKS
jgi:hypothetical protein